MTAKTRRKRKRNSKPKPPVQRKGWSITEWCVRRGIGRSSFYELDKVGQAPLTLYLLNRRIITEEADERWLREREADAVAARLEA